MLDSTEEVILNELSNIKCRPYFYPISKGDMKSIEFDGLRYILNGDGSEELYDFDLDPQERTTWPVRQRDRRPYLSTVTCWISCLPNPTTHKKSDEPSHETQTQTESNPSNQSPGSRLDIPIHYPDQSLGGPGNWPDGGINPILPEIRSAPVDWARPGLYLDGASSGRIDLPDNRPAV